MTDRNRSTTLRLRTPAAPSAASAPAAGAAPRSFGAVPPRPGMEPRRPLVQTFIPRRADPTSQAILAELAALGLADPDEGE
jgi:hypothetical protein